MPTFEFTSPEGKSYSVDGPAGATKEQAFEMLQKQIGAPAPAAISPPTPAGIPGQGGGIPIPPRPPEPSIGKKALGAGEAALSVLSGIPASIGGAAAGVYQGITGGKYGTPEGALEADKRAADVAKKFTYAPRTAPGQDYVKGVGDIIGASKLGGLGPTEAMMMAGVSGPATTAAKSGASKVAKAVAESPEGELIKQGASAVGKAIQPKVAPETAALAQKAIEMGIPLRPDMLTDNKFMRMIGEAMEKVPLSGSNAEQRQAAFNQNLMKMIGGEESPVKKLTPDVFDRAITASGERIGEIAKKTPVPVDADLIAALQKHLANTSKETADVTKIITAYVKEIQDAGVGGIIPGEALRKINSEMGRKMRSSGNGDLRHALGELQEDLHNALARNLDPESLAQLEMARRQYAIAKTIEPLVAKSATGDISPQGLMQATTADRAGKARMARGNGGELGDLARIGQKFLKEPGSSGTAERGVAYGLLGGGAAINPYAAGGIYAGANVYNRAGPAIARKMLGTQGKDPALTPKMREVLGVE